MTVAQIDSVLEKLKAGVIEASDLEWLEHLTSREVLAELSGQYPIKFLERRRPKKWEVGLAQNRRRNMYHHCLLLTSEADRLTTLAMLTLVRIRPPRKPASGYEISCGGGFSLYRDPNGWKLKLLHEQTISLSRTSLESRGWLVR